MELQFFKKTQTLVYILISQALYLGHIVLHGLEALLLLHHVFAHEISFHLKLTPLKVLTPFKDLLRGIIFLRQLSVQ